jgi:hypothetical protein
VRSVPGAVDAVFGTEFVPVTCAAHCYFVDPAHVFDIQVNIDPGKSARQPAHRAEREGRPAASWRRTSTRR